MTNLPTILKRFGNKAEFWDMEQKAFKRAHGYIAQWLERLTSFCDPRP